MKVLIVTDWPLRWAGTERYVMDLHEGLIAAGHESRLMTSSIGSQAEGRAAYVARTTERRRAQAVLQVVNPSALATMGRALRDFDPDAVHLAMFLPYLSPAVLAPLGRRPTTLMAVDLKPVCPVGTKLLPDGRQCRVRMGAVCRREGCLPPAARGPRPRPLRGLPGRTAERRPGLRLQPPRHRRAGAGGDRGRVPAAAGPGAGAVPRRRPSAHPHFVYAGRLAPVKGLSMLLRAFAELRESNPAATLLICGDGRHRDEVIAEVSRLGLRGAVELVLGMPRDWTERLADAWALVAPSLYREPLGLVAIEAIVRGVPVIAAGEGGFAESVEEGRTGMLIPNGDQRALLERMRDVCEGRAFPDHLADPEAGARLARRHDLGDHVRRMETAWKEIGA